MSNTEIVPWGWENPRTVARVHEAFTRLNERLGDVELVLNTSTNSDYTSPWQARVRFDNVIHYYPVRNKTVTRESLKKMPRPQHPLTPWIVFHRMAHRFQFANLQSKTWKNAHVERCFDIIAQIAHRTNKVDQEHARKSLFLEGETSGPSVEAFYSYATCRSARARTLNTSLDIFSELFAQWAITGRVQLNGGYVVKNLQRELDNEFAGILRSIRGSDFTGF